MRVGRLRLEAEATEAVPDHLRRVVKGRESGRCLSYRTPPSSLPPCVPTLLARPTAGSYYAETALSFSGDGGSGDVDGAQGLKTMAAGRHVRVIANVAHIAHLSLVLRLSEQLATFLRVLFRELDTVYVASRTNAGP
ncbi:hypothetical protein MTO96_019677 [Rhipicephalus appendiculatus]